MTIKFKDSENSITNHKWKSDAAKSIAENMLKDFKGQWLVGVIMPEVELTNNKDHSKIDKKLTTANFGFIS